MGRLRDCCPWRVHRSPLRSPACLVLVALGGLCGHLLWLRPLAWEVLAVMLEIALLADGPGWWAGHVLENGDRGEAEAVGPGSGPASRVRGNSARHCSEAKRTSQAKQAIRERASTPPRGNKGLRT